MGHGRTEQDTHQGHGARHGVQYETQGTAVQYGTQGRARPYSTGYGAQQDRTVRDISHGYGAQTRQVKTHTPVTHKRTDIHDSHG